MVTLRGLNLFFCQNREDSEAFIKALADLGVELSLKEYGNGHETYFMVYAHSRTHIKACVIPNDRAVGREYCEYKEGDEICFSYEDMLNSGKYFSRSRLLDCNTDEVRYARKSHLYNKIMADGNVFNPYIHRRFLPHQYISLIETCHGNIDCEIMKNYNLSYALTYTRKEIRKLAMLCKNDRKTFKERSRFFRYDVIYAVIKQGVEKVTENLYKCECEKSREFSINGRNMLKEIIRANSYDMLEDVIKRYSDVYETLCIKGKSVKEPVCREWIEAFKASGAYYTMKHLIMFEGYVFYEKQTQAEAVIMLEGMLLKDADVLHEKCVNMLDRHNRNE